MSVLFLLLPAMSVVHRVTPPKRSHARRRRRRNIGRPLHRLNFARLQSASPVEALVSSGRLESKHRSELIAPVVGLLGGSACEGQEFRCNCSSGPVIVGC